MKRRQATWTLHLENVALRAEIRQLRAKVTRLESAPRCAYCGYPCRRGSNVCVEHADLPGIDRGYGARVLEVAA